MLHHEWHNLERNLVFSSLFRKQAQRGSGQDRDDWTPPHCRYKGEIAFKLAGGSIRYFQRTQAWPGWNWFVGCLSTREEISWSPRECGGHTGSQAASCLSTHWAAHYASRQAGPSSIHKDARMLSISFTSSLRSSQHKPALMERPDTPQKASFRLTEKRGPLAACGS